MEFYLREVWRKPWKTSDVAFQINLSTNVEWRKLRTLHRPPFYYSSAGRQNVQQNKDLKKQQYLTIVGARNHAPETHKGVKEKEGKREEWKEQEGMKIQE